MTSGIWTEEEHDRFLAAIKNYPRGPWLAIAEAVGTRSVRQVQTHTQKYYEKIMRRLRGLRKDRKTWARVEHRIDDDILVYCESIKSNGVTIPPTVESAAPTASASDQGNDPLGRFDALDCLGPEAATGLPVDLDCADPANLPSLEEALDFLIALMEQ